MSDDWKVGDLAVCVDARENPLWETNAGLREGCAYTIAGVALPSPCAAFSRQTPLPGLFLVELDAGTPCGFAPERFRKIRPDKHEDCEPEFVTLLKRSKVEA